MTLLEEMQARLAVWFGVAAPRTRIEGHSSITFELFGDSRGYTPAGEPIYEVAVREEFFSGTLKPSE